MITLTTELPKRLSITDFMEMISNKYIYKMANEKTLYEYNQEILQ